MLSIAFVRLRGPLIVKSCSLASPGPLTSATTLSSLITVARPIHLIAAKPVASAQGQGSRC